MSVDESPYYSENNELQAFWVVFVSKLRFQFNTIS